MVNRLLGGVEAPLLLATRGFGGFLVVWGFQRDLGEMGGGAHSPETNSQFAPENSNGWKMKPFLLGPGPFSGAFAVGFRECNRMENQKISQTIGTGTHSKTHTFVWGVNSHPKMPQECSVKCYSCYSFS